MARAHAIARRWVRALAAIPVLLLASAAQGFPLEWQVESRSTSWRAALEAPLRTGVEGGEVMLPPLVLPSGPDWELASARVRFERADLVLVLRAFERVEGWNVPFWASQSIVSAESPLAWVPERLMPECELDGLGGSLCRFDGVVPAAEGELQGFTSEAALSLRYEVGFLASLGYLHVHESAEFWGRAVFDIRLERPIPEPATGLLVAAGLAGLAALARRRR